MGSIDLTPLQAALAALAPQGRTALLPALHAAQDIYGYLPEPAAAVISQALGIPLADVFGVIEFYSLFYTQPVGKTIIRVCTDPSCALAGGDQILDALANRLELQEGHTSPNGEFTLERSPCLGLCEHAPAALVNQDALGGCNLNELDRLLAGDPRQPGGKIYAEIALLTANCGKGRPTRLAEYEQNGGYLGLRKCLARDPFEIIAEIKAAGLVGRGGAAFPTGVKWEGAARAEGEPKYVVCNADESEPGTFKDRVLLEEDPHRILEGMLIAGYAIGAQHGYIYMRGEYPHAYQVLAQAVQEARSAGYLGRTLTPTGFQFDIELRRGAGAYICGEETALFESIEGKRGYPRLKPPFPTTNGLFGKPTIINNVETLCNVPLIMTMGASKYREIGTPQSPGPKLFCVSGDVERPGLYEAPFGITLRHLLDDLAGGVRQGRQLQAILFGGAAGAFAVPAQLDVKLTFEDLRAAGLPLGSGVVMVIDDTRDLRDVLLRLAKFFAHESCGKCYPCQIGTLRQLEVLERIASANILPDDLERLLDVGWTMTDASICGLGQTAASAVLSAINLWPELFKE